MLKKLLLIAFISSSLFAQLSWDIELSPLYRMQYHDGSELELPFRIFEGSAVYSVNDFEFKTSTALQSRWTELENSEISIREMYVHYYPFFGEVKLGKQILAWGYADQNNPTDNINPYNYYYLFEAGIDRKEAVNAAALTINISDLSVDAVLSEHNENVFPYDEEDFPFTLPAQADPRGRTQELESPFEYGLRLRHSLLGVDYSLSYWQGYDKQATPSLVYADPAKLMTGIEPEIEFSYRKTSVLGGDFVSFINDFTLRAEGAYFSSENTSTIHDNFKLKIPMKAEYLQYVAQVEYTTPIDIQIAAQYMGHKILNAEGLLDPNKMMPAIMQAISTDQTQLIPIDSQELFKASLGSPLHNFMESALSISASALLLDNQLDLRVAGIFNLIDSGTIFSISAEYFLNDAIGIKLYSSNIFSSTDDQNDFFYIMKDFSYLGVGLSYRIGN